MRVKGGMVSKKKRRTYLKAAKGYRGAPNRRFSLAKQAFIRAGVYAFAGRKQKKRDFRRLWITRINAGARLAGSKYNELMYGLKVAGVSVNRKMLADLAVRDFDTFKEYVEIAKEALSK